MRELCVCVCVCELLGRGANEVKNQRIAAQT
jgi:hypothetical protein